MSLKCMKKVIPIIAIILFLNSCLPECSKPKCMYTDVYPDSPIIANLSGNFDSVINVGDTFKISIKIPDTINTNYGLLKLKSVNSGSFHFIKYTGTSTYWDSLTGDDLRLKLVVLKGLGPTPQQNFQHMGWDASGNYEALFIPTKKGKYHLHLRGSGTEIVTIDDEEWRINLNIQFQKDRPFRVEQYRNFFGVESHKQQVTFEGLAEVKDYYYWFEAK